MDTYSEDLLICRTALSHHVMGVGDAQVVVKALVGWKKHPLLPDSKVPLPHHSCSVAHRFQHLSDGSLIQRKTAYRAWVEHSWVDP